MLLDQKRRTSIVYRSFACGPLEDWQTWASQEHIVTNFHVIKERWVTKMCLLMLFISEIIPESMPASVCYYDLLLQVVDIFYVLSLCRQFHPADFWSVRMLIELLWPLRTIRCVKHYWWVLNLIAIWLKSSFQDIQRCFYVWCKHVAFANLCLVCVFVCQIL